MLNLRRPLVRCAAPLPRRLASADLTAPAIPLKDINRVDVCAPGLEMPAALPMKSPLAPMAAETMLRMFHQEFNRTGFARARRAMPRPGAGLRFFGVARMNSAFRRAVFREGHR